MHERIILIHTLKCGGTSLRHMLLEEYGYNAICPVRNGEAKGIYPYPTTDGFPLVWQERVTPAEVNRYKVIMGHIDVRILSRLPGWWGITMLRDPVRQLLSLYQFMSRMKRFYPTFQQEYPNFRYWLEHRSSKPYHNLQTTYLSGHNKRDVDIALANLHHPRLVFGLVEEFNKGIEHFNTRFGWSMRAQHLNVSPKRVELSPEVESLTQKYQQKDIRLYNAARELFTGLCVSS